MEKNRIQWIDVFKGILIFLMVVGHSTTPYAGYIYLFHMPAFIFISGYTTNLNKYGLKSFIVLKLKSLIVPFIGINIIYIFMRFVMQLLNLENIFYADKMDVVFQFKMFGMYLSTIDLGGATWFLVVLFEAAIISYAINWIINKINLPAIFSLIVALLILLYSYTLFKNNVLYPYYFDLALSATAYFLIGNYFKIKEIFIKMDMRILVPVSLFLVYFYGKLNYIPMNWPTRSFATITENLLGAISGIVLLYFVSLLVSQNFNKISVYVSTIGRNSLNILIYHFLVFRIFYVLLYFIGVSPISQIQQLVPPAGNKYWLFLSAISVVSITYLIETYKKIINSKKMELTTVESTTVETTKKAMYIYCIIAIAFVYFANQWVISLSNGFTFDDYAWLNKAHFSSYKELFSIIPTTRYNDRPVGAVFIKMLYDSYGLNYVKHHQILLFTHIFNALMLFRISVIMMKLKKSKVPYFIAMITVFIFGAYPRSLMAIQWDASVFDLLGATFVLLMINIYFEALKKNGYRNFYLICLFVLYLFALRTKEMTVVLPMILILLRIHFFEKVSKVKVKDYIFEIVMMGTMFVYAIYVNLLSSVNNITENALNPYFINFNPLIIIRNFIRYISMYFNVNSSTFVFDKYYFYSILLILIFLGLFIYDIFTYIKKKKINFIVYFIIVVISLAPVLIMQNMQHVLYLYIPSIFISLLVTAWLNELINRYVIVYKSRLIIGFSVALLLTIVSILPGTKGFRDYWAYISDNNQLTISELRKISTPPLGANIYIENANDNFNVFYYGPGFINQILFNDNSLTTYINETAIDESKPYVRIRYDEGKLEEIERMDLADLYPLEIIASYPNSLIKGESFNVQVNGDSAMAFEVRNATESTKIYINGEEQLTTFGNSELLTVIIPRDLLMEAGTIQVDLRDETANIISETYSIEINERTN